MKKLTLCLVMIFLISYCYGAWDNDLPADSSTWNNAAAEIRANWDAIEVIHGVDLVKSGNFFNVIQYGADNTGATDSTTAVDAAIAAAASAGSGTIFFPAGDYKFEVTDSSVNAVIHYVGDGLDTIIKPLTAGNYALTFTGLGNWNRKVVKNLKFSGNISAARQGNGIHLNSGNITVEITKCWFEECDFAITQVKGPGGNHIWNNKFASNNYGYHVSNGSDSAHVGNQLFEFNYWAGNKFAAIFIDGFGASQILGGQYVIKQDIFEDNNFAIYAQRFGSSETTIPFTIDIIWLEGSNGVAAGDNNNITNGDSEVITPIATYFKSIGNLVINSTRFEAYTFDTCNVRTFNCIVNQASNIQTETDSIIHHFGTNAVGSGGVHFDQISQLPNISTTSNHGFSSIVPERDGLTQTQTNLITTNASGVGAFTVNATPDSDETFEVIDGQFGECVEVLFVATQTINDALQLWPWAVTSGKYYIFSYNVKGNGSDFDLTTLLTGSDQVHGKNNDISVKDGIWQTVAGICRADASGTNRFYFWQTGATTPTIRICAAQIVEFTNKADALAYLAGNSYAMPTEMRKMQTRTVDLTAAQIKALADPAIEIVPAQGANTLVEFVSAVLVLDNATNYSDASGNGNLIINYTDKDGVAVSASIEADGFIDATADTITHGIAITDGIVAASASVNKALVIWNNGTNYTTGTGVIRVVVNYNIHTDLGL